MGGCHPDAQGAQSPGRTVTRLEGESLPRGAGSRAQGVLLRGSLSSCSGFRPGVVCWLSLQIMLLCGSLSQSAQGRGRAAEPKERPLQGSWTWEPGRGCALHAGCSGLSPLLLSLPGGAGCSGPPRTRGSCALGPLCRTAVSRQLPGCLVSPPPASVSPAGLSSRLPQLAVSALLSDLTPLRTQHPASTTELGGCD